MANMHVADLDRRANASKERRQSRNVVKKIRTHSPASSTGTFFDDDQTVGQSSNIYRALADMLQNGETLSVNTSWSGSSRADSAMSSRSDERSKANDHGEQWRLQRINEVKSSAAPGQQERFRTNPYHPDVWPQALRIVKSPKWEDPRPAPSPKTSTSNSSFQSATVYATSQHNSSSDSVMSRPRPKMHKRFDSTAHDDSSSGSAVSSRTNSQDHTGYEIPPDSAVGFENPWSPPPLTSPVKHMPGTVNSLAAMGSAPREARQMYMRSRTQPSPAPFHKPTSSTDWTAIAPNQRRRPEPLARMPTPPQSPSRSITDLYSPDSGLESAEIVIGRRVTVKGRDRSSSVPESAMSPKSPSFPDLAFPSPPGHTDSSRTTLIHAPTVSQTNMPPPGRAPEKQLPPHPFTKRRSLSADEAGKRAKLDEQEDKPEAPAPYRVLHSTNNSTTDFRGMISPSMYRPDRMTVVTETLRELNAKSAGHFERYTKLRQGRQMLHSEILSVLQGTSTRGKGAKTPLQLQLEIATMDAGIDDCMSKLSNLEKKRQKLVDELVNLSTARSPSLHGRKESLGIQEIIQTPRSPPVGGMAAIMEGFGRMGVEDKYSQKNLPKVPRKEITSSASLSLANIMDFLDTDDQEGY